MGAIQERNNLIDKAIVEYKICHDKYFPNGRALTDDEWTNFINKMDSIAEKYKNTSIELLSGKLCMAFLDDMEIIHRAWVEKKKLNRE